MDRTFLYNIIYALAARDGREKPLFGGYSPLAQEAFERSLVPQALPELWFELPLAGDPWFDLHVLTSYGDVAGTQATFAGLDGAYADGLAWFAAQPPATVRQLALSYDVSQNDVEHPAIQLLVNRRDDAVPQGFLRAVGRADAAEAYAAFAERMPREWYPCYVGVFPRREVAGSAAWTRVECLLGAAQQDYAHDAARLRDDLARIGLACGAVTDAGAAAAAAATAAVGCALDEAALACIQELARASFPLELQLNVGAQGLAQPCLSASLRFQPADWADPARRAKVDAVFELLQDQGMVDDRWRLLGDGAFAQRLSKDGASCTLTCFPAFIKLRWRAGQPADAKTYLMATLD